MPNITTVNLTAGIPTGPAGASTVSTIDALMALVGEVQASPTSLTALDRLKTIAANIASATITTGTAGTASAAVLTVQGIAGATPQPVTQTASATANGQTSSRVNAAATTNATSLKASAGQVGEIDVFNNAAYAVFLKLYNKASAPTVGTDTPVWTIPIQAGGGFARSFPRGKTFATGIAYAITKLQADSDTTVLVAGDLTGSIDWI